MYQYIYYLIRKHTEDKANRISQSNNFYFKNYLMENILKNFFTEIKLFKNA